ncbi:dihydropteroate synthase [Cytophaga aurantiaca]|uniref:dihydropteroate synthase n=1 Tax=Cytophaga aurantiaca TaxID=29530 RepID=UPI001FDEC6C2|nr:dihydropteroate synthase [Cytophaga aurantiaca]
MKDFKDTFFYRKTTSSSRGKLIDWSKPTVMGIINVTPDSFFDGGVNNSVAAALDKASQMVAAGVDIIDIGGYSSRPQAIDISEEEEIARIVPVINAIKQQHPSVLLSVDTFRAAVAQKAIENGIDIVNDITGGVLDADMFDVVAKGNVIYCMMHMRGTPQTMTQQTDYQNLVSEIMQFFIEQLKKARDKGIKDILLDPGFGFAKTQEQNYQLLKELDVFKIFELPLLIGVSRKSMIYKTLNTSAAAALNGSTVLHTIALQKGAHIFRVHDVEEVKEVFELVKNL